MEAAKRPIAVAECRLDLDGLRDQRERYRALGRSVTSLDRRAGTLEISFGPDLDASLLERTLAVERECCPFFLFDDEPNARRLTVSVERADQEPALEAIADALAA